MLWLTNAVRIAALVGIGTWGFPQVALGGFHSQAGWLAFNGLALGLVAATQRARFFRSDTETITGANPAAPYLLPLLALVATAMVTGAFASGLDRFYGLRVLAAASVLCLYRRHYTSLLGPWSWSALAVGAAVFVAWLALEPPPSASSGDDAVPAGLASLPRGWAVLWLTFRVVGSVVVVPLAEELAFRGYLMRRLIAADFREVPLGQFSWFSFLVSSVLFGALHQRWLAGALAGVFYALCLYRRGGLMDAVLAHATTNALIAACVLITGKWSLWD